MEETIMTPYPGTDDQRQDADRLELARWRNTLLEADNAQLQDRLRDRDDIDKSLEFISGEVIAIASDVARLAGSVDRLATAVERLAGTELQLCDVMRELADVIQTAQPRKPPPTPASPRRTGGKP
jgi:hypothetical protein